MDEHEILEAHHVRGRGDNAWQRRARLMQALWRERVGLPEPAPALPKLAR